MAGKEGWLKPKTSSGPFDKVKTKNGQFVNTDPFPKMGGFTGVGKLSKPDPSMALEKSGPSSAKGKPI